MSSRNEKSDLSKLHGALDRGYTYPSHNPRPPSCPLSSKLSSDMLRSTVAALWSMVTDVISVKLGIRRSISGKGLQLYDNISEAATRRDSPMERIP